MNILDWTAHRDIRDYLNSPFNVDGHTVATNGHYMMITSLDGSYGENQVPASTYSNCMNFINDIDHNLFKPVSIENVDIEMCKCPLCSGTGKASSRECEECDGHGEVDIENDYNEYCVECKSCDGDGSISAIGGEDECPNCDGNKDVPVNKYNFQDVCGIRLQVEYAKKISELTDLEAYPNGDKIYFKSGDNFGVVMGCRETK